MPAVRKKLLDGIDQYSAYYSVICVFGSVVGCVVVPLITQVPPRPCRVRGGRNPLRLGYPVPRDALLATLIPITTWIRQSDNSLRWSRRNENEGWGVQVWDGRPVRRLGALG